MMTVMIVYSSPAHNIVSRLIFYSVYITDYCHNINLAPNCNTDD